MPRYIGQHDILEVIAEGMKTPRFPIELDTDEGPFLFKVTYTHGKFITGESTDGKLVTIDPDHPEQITVT